MALVRKPSITSTLKSADTLPTPTVIGKSITVRKWMGDPDPPPATKGKKPRQQIVNGQPRYLQSTALDREIVFGSLYTQEGMSGALRPPYDPDRLAELIENNNALEPCIQAMITNVDGTGFEIVADNEDVTVPDDTLDQLKGFFTEPWPGTSFLEMRKQLRRDFEGTGNAYLEVIRNLEGKIALVRRMDPYVTRIMRLGNDTYLEDIYSPTLNTTIQVQTRRRRYVQYIFGRLIYFKEFGAPLDLNRLTGKWEDEGGGTSIAHTDSGTAQVTGDGVPPDRRANEVIHFKNVPHHILPYGVPRWINQTPSVLGSRRAEEFNLGFFDQGGIPPMLIIIQGGEAAESVEKAIKDLMYSPGPQKTTAAVLQVINTSGEIDNPGNVKVTVERFGTERQKDQLFQEYDKNCESKVRKSWRLPDLFVGSIKEATYACHDDKTETLTDRGWVTLDGWEPGMRVACVDPKTHSIEYHEPIGKMPLVYEVEDVDMHVFESTNTDVAVTPNHRMLSRLSGEWVVLPVEQMLAKRTRHTFLGKVSGGFKGSDIVEFAPPWIPPRTGVGVAYAFQPRPIPGDDWIELIGWYITEGNVHMGGWELDLTQKFDRHWAQINKLASRLESAGYLIRHHGKNVTRPDQRMLSIQSIGVCQWFMQNTGGKSHEKYLPEMFRDLSERQAQLLFDTMMKGDGSWDYRGHRTSGSYATTSRRLADDVQELAIRLGYRAQIVDAPPGTFGIRPMFVVNLSRAARGKGDGSGVSIRKPHIRRQRYTGRVYCFTVPTGVFVTRRNGKMSVHGNSALASYRVAENQVFKPERDRFDEKITSTILYAIGGDKLRGKIKMRSLPITNRDVQQQLEAIQIALGYPSGPTMTKEELVNNLNEITDMDIKVITDAEMMKAAKQQQAMNPQPPPGQPGKPGQQSQDQYAGKPPPGKLAVPISAEGARPQDDSRVGTKVMPLSGKVKADTSLVEDAMADGIVQALVNGKSNGHSDMNGLKTKQELFDSTNYLRKNPQMRDALGHKVGKILFRCAPNEESAAAALADALIYSSGE